MLSGHPASSFDTATSRELRPPPDLAPPHLGLDPRSEPEFIGFDPHVLNPELWRTTQPLIVRWLCQNHKGMIATWTAIHWLIVFYAGKGRCALGVRQIAEQASVGRNELTGPTGYLQRLVDLGLIQIVGYEHIPGFKAPRPIYAVDLADLERKSINLVREHFADIRLSPVRQRPGNPPQQISFRELLEATPEHQGAPGPDSSTPTPSHRTADTDDDPASRAVGREQAPTAAAARHDPSTLPEPTAQQPGTFPRQEPDAISRQPLQPAPHAAANAPLNPSGMPGEGQGRPSAAYGSRPNHGSNQDHQLRTAATADAHPAQAPASTASAEEPLGEAPVRGSSQAPAAPSAPAEREGASDDRRTTEASTVAATAALVIKRLQEDGILSPAPAAPSAAIPPTPPSAPPLPDALLHLWQGDATTITPRDRQQILMLAAEYEAPTGGYGAYWVGRAILIAARCLTERGQTVGINYLRA
ncbi:MAG: hypothetical protein EOM24_25350, partial [Chloroflexia bacterium]|nr:hypothetical protein [Chloroflexia bacterium]